MSTEIETANTFTVPHKEGRPIVVTGACLSMTEWEEPRSQRGYSGDRRTHTPYRARLIEMEDGTLIYHAEQQAEDGTWHFDDSHFWTSADSVRGVLLTNPIKELLRTSGSEAYGEMTYRNLTEPPSGNESWAIVLQDGAPDLRVAGTLLAQGVSPIRDGNGYYFPETANPVMVFGVAHGYLLVYFGRGGAKHPPMVRHVFCPTPVDVYAEVTWSHRPDDSLFRDEISPEPPAGAVRLLEKLASVDDAFQPVAYRVIGSDDPVAAEWQRRRAVWVEKELEQQRQEEDLRRRRQEIFAQEQAERERIAAEEQARWEAEGARLTQEAQEQETTPPEPTIADRAFEILQRGLDSDAENIRVAAATALYLGERLQSQSSNEW